MEAMHHHLTKMDAVYVAYQSKKGKGKGGNGSAIQSKHS